MPKVEYVITGLTTVQQSGQNHHMRASATRMKSTRKTMATTKPSDCTREGQNDQLIQNKKDKMVKREKVWWRNRCIR